MNITYRTGKKQDCPKMAEFVYIASDGVVEYLFHDLIEGVSPIQTSPQRLLKKRRWLSVFAGMTNLKKSGPVISAKA